MHSEIEQGFICENASERSVGQAVDAITPKQELSSGEAWQYLDAKDGTLSSNASISDIFRQHGFSGKSAGPLSQDPMSWYSFDAFGRLNATFGVELPSDKVENPMHSMVKAEPQLVDRRMEFGDSSSGSGVAGHWAVNKFCASIDGGKGSGGTPADQNPRSPRIIASVTPTQFASSVESAVPADSHSAEIPTSHFSPPPLVPFQSLASTVSHVLAPFSGSHMPNATTNGLEVLGLRRRPASLAVRELRSPADELMLESEPEELDDGHFSPPPQRIYEEDHRSASAM